jgi:hypothetical protein
MMKWIAVIVVGASFLYGIEIGWRKHDLVLYPISGFLVGLFFFWLLWAFWASFNEQLGHQRVGPALFWLSTVVALYYCVFAAFAIYRGYYDSGLGLFVGLAAFSWGIGWLIRRAGSAKRSN